MHNILAAMVNFTSRAHTVIPDLSPCRPRVTEPNYEQYCRIGKHYYCCDLAHLVTYIKQETLSKKV